MYNHLSTCSNGLKKGFVYTMRKTGKQYSYFILKLQVTIPMDQVQMLGRILLSIYYFYGEENVDSLINIFCRNNTLEKQ